MDRNQKTYTILGIDPGTRITGYGIISTDLSSFHSLDYGAICPPPKLPLFKRQLIIYESISHLLDIHSIDAIAIESQYVSKNPQSALKLGMAKGVTVLAGTKRGIPVFEYAPTQAKNAVVGTGKATKEQVGRMIQALLHLSELPHPEDASDALALAICHANNLKPQGASYA